MIEAIPRFLQKQTKKIASLPATQFYPYKAWPRILSAISTTRNVSVHVRTYVDEKCQANQLGYATCEKESRGFKMFGPKFYKLG